MMTDNKNTRGTIIEKLRLFRYWATREFDLVVDGKSSRIRCSAGSNASTLEAEKLCGEKAVRVQQIVNSQTSRESSYERPTREEIVKELDNDNVITRNYYGAQILNTASVSIFDIDSYQKTFWEKITFKKINNKTAILGRLRELYEQRVLPGTTWRVYETAKGMRLIVLGQYIGTESQLFSSFCKQINADNLYARLCRHQQCYRARLTPKPFRMKIQGIKYRIPIPQGEERVYRDWVSNYEQESQGYSVCRLVETLGSSVVDNQIVELHDRFCCGSKSLTLA